MTAEADITTMAGDLTKLLTMVARASLRDHRSGDFAPILTGSLAAAAAGLGEAEDSLQDAFDDDSDQDQLSPEREAALDNLRRRYADSYAQYAEQFAAAVESVAADLGLTLPPQVRADADPNSAWWKDRAVHNSIDSDSALVHELWERPHATVPLPNVDIRLDQTGPREGG